MQPLGYINSLFLGKSQKNLGNLIRYVRGSSEENTIETKLERVTEERMNAIAQDACAMKQEVDKQNKDNNRPMSYLEAAKKGIINEVSNKPVSDENLSKPSYADIVKRSLGFSR